MRKRIIDHFSESEVIKLTDEEISAYENLWLGAFCNYSKKEKNEIHLSEFKWHTFSFEKFSSLSGNEAEEAYTEQKAHLYIVLPEFQAYKDEVAFSTTIAPKTELADLLTDFYVFPKNMAWTMAFTHEHGWLGPYFAKHLNYEKLNKHNLQALQAKKNGW